MTIFYCVQVMRHWDSLRAGPFALNIEAAAPGCIAFMPIFKDEASAIRWRDEEHPTATIAAITYDLPVNGSPNAQ